MYSPKISEELVHNLYRIAKAKKVSMARLVNDIVWEAIKDIKVETQIVREETEVEREVYLIQEEKSM